MVVYISAIFRPMSLAMTLFQTNGFSDQWHAFSDQCQLFSDQCQWFSDQCHMAWQCHWHFFGPMAMSLRTNAMPMGFRTNGNAKAMAMPRQWAIGLMVFRTNGSSDQWQWAVGPSTWHHYVYNTCRSPKGMSNRRDAIGSRQDTSIIDHHTCTVHILHRVYTVFTSCTLYLLGSFGRW